MPKTIQMKTALAAVLMLFAVSSTAEAVSLESDKICLPYGSKQLDQIDDADFNRSHVLRTDIEFGLAKLKKGCEVGFQIPFEAGSEHSREKLRSVRTIAFIRCENGFYLADKLLLSASFDLAGCLESLVFLREPTKICGTMWPTDATLQFKKGRIKCPGK